MRNLSGLAWRCPGTRNLVGSSLETEVMRRPKVAAASQTLKDVIWGIVFSVTELSSVPRFPSMHTELGLKDLMIGEGGETSIPPKDSWPNTPRGKQIKSARVYVRYHLKQKRFNDH